MTIDPEDIRGSVERYLETDRLLGAREAPLYAPAPPKTPDGPARPASPRPGSASRPAPRGEARAPSATKAAASPPVDAALRSQNIPDEEKTRRRAALDALDASQVKSCVKCALSGTRTNTVFGQGNAAARLVFVGEAPGADEDAQGLAFIGRAGQLLTKMIVAMGLTRDDVFICNILKCRPPNNRDPAPDEISSCWPYLDEQLRIISPEVIVALGKPAAQTLLRTRESIGRLRGRWHDYYTSGTTMVGEPTPLMPTFHPAYLLRNAGEKGKAWGDLKAVMARLGLPVP